MNDQNEKETLIIQKEQTLHNSNFEKIRIVDKQRKNIDIYVEVPDDPEPQMFLIC